MNGVIAGLPLPVLVMIRWCSTDSVECLLLLQRRDGYGTPGCPLTRELATAPIKPVFAPTGWKTLALDHITFLTPDYRKEATFYVALMGWQLRSDDSKQAVLDIGGWGSAVFKQAPERVRYNYR
jgi:hypothetical protein